MAVFSYQVPRQKSHYEVQVGWLAAGVTLDDSTFSERAGYHGEMTVDPASGVILRVTVDAELVLGDPLTRAAIMVEYGAVEIGGKSVICPRHSVALSRMDYAHVSHNGYSVLDKNPQQTRVNDVAFEQYHQLRGDARILPAGAEDAGAESAGLSSEEASGSGSSGTMPEGRKTPLFTETLPLRRKWKTRRVLRQHPRRQRLQQQVLHPRQRPRRRSAWWPRMGSRMPWQPRALSRQTEWR